MLHGVFRTKEGKIITAVLLLILILIGTFMYIGYKANRHYKEQNVMAEKFLKDGNYGQAVEAYLKALSMKNSDEEKLSIGLAEAYAGMNEYDRALEVLRSNYQKTSSIILKEKIEEITLRKTEYEYLQIISRADVYFTNEEYEKAITEYEKAKKIKSKEVTSYLKIAEAYIKIGDYNKALEEVEEGLVLTHNVELEQMKDKVNSYQQKQEYDIIVADAAEYIYQENYEDGVKKYKEAIRLIPEEEQAYIELAQAYLNIKEYQKAVTLIQGALNLFQSDDLEGLLKKAYEFVAIAKEKERIVSELYYAANQENVEQILNLMSTDIFKEEIAVDAPVYYSQLGEQDIVNGRRMVIYDSENIYIGEMLDGLKKGSGIYFMLTPKYGEQSYYYYLGDWKNDIPNGKGKTVEVKNCKNTSEKEYEYKLVTEGTYFNGMENGQMKKTFYEDGTETGQAEYLARKGVPMPALDENGKPIPKEKGKPYPVGMLYFDQEPTGEYLMVDYITLWGVKPFISDEIN